MVRRRDEDLDLAAAGLLIACEEYPRLDVDEYLTRLDLMAAELGRSLDLEAEPQRIAAALSAYLSGDMGFHGNQEEYFDPRNSFLNDVLDRRTGIPITLSVVYMEVARRLALPVVGAGLPGHLIVKYVAGEDDILIDPFNGGAILSREDCHELVKTAYGPDVPFRESFLAAPTKRQILSRILYNLKGLYLRNDDFARAQGTVELLLAISPWDLEEIRDRGMLSYRLHAYDSAVRDLETYLRHCPQATDAANVRQTLEAVQVLGREER